MNDLNKAWKHAPGLFIILLFGLFVEGSNFQNTFYKFMLAYRPDWGNVNHVTSLVLSAFLLFNIVEWGMRAKKEISWVFAMLTMVISFSVYSRIELKWNFTELTEMHLVVLILSIVLPAVVAYTTHSIRNELNEINANQKTAQATQPKPSPLSTPTFTQQPTNGSATGNGNGNPNPLLQATQKPILNGEATHAKKN